MRNIMKGKRMLIAIIILNLLFCFASTVMVSAAGFLEGAVLEATLDAATGAVRFALTCLLFFFIYKGHRWARIVAVILFGVAGIILLLGSLVADGVMLLVGIVYVICEIVLVSRPVKEYQEFKYAGEKAVL